MEFFDIIHIGAHKAEEVEKYKDKSVLWVEPNPYLAEKIRERKLNVLECAVGGKNGKAILNIANDTQASTLNEWTGLKSLHTELKIVKQVEVKVIKYDELPKCTQVIIDAEGSEYDIVKNAKKLPNIVTIELNWDRFNTPNGNDVIELMISKGYRANPYKIKHGHADVTFTK